MLSKRIKHLHQRFRESPKNVPSLFIKRFRSLFSRRFSPLLGYYSPAPEVIMLYLTERCNLNCEVCFLRHIKLEYKELDVSKWIKIIDEITPWSPGVSISGGEPLLYKGIDDILYYLKDKGLSTTVTTNGTLIDRHISPIIENVKRLKISIDGPAEIHNKLRGIKGTYEQIIHNIGLLNQEKAKRNTQTPFLTMYTILTTEILPYIEEMIETGIEMGFQQIRFLHLLYLSNEDIVLARKKFPDKLHYWNGAVFDPENLIDGEKIAETIQRIKRKRYPIIVEFEPDFNSNEIIKYYRRDNDFFGKFSGRCKMPWSSMTIKQDGRVEICPDYIIGNVNKTHIPEIWNSEKAKELRKFILHKGMFPVCKGCCAFYD